MIIGTTNPHKIREIGSICVPLDISLEPCSLEIEETNTTFEDNARQKAIGYSEANKDKYVLSEDSGLVIPVLSNLPGPWSARFDDLDIKTKKVTYSNRDRETIDIANTQRVLKLMKNVPSHIRGAHFIVCLIIIKNNNIVFQTTQKSHGWILSEPKGKNNFGYDPIFASDASFGKSWAEIDNVRKNLISHRGRALRDLQAWLCSDIAKDVQ